MDEFIGFNIDHKPALARLTDRGKTVAPAAKLWHRP